MSGIGGVGGGYGSYNPYQNLSSGKKLNSAANGASELAIAEKHETQVNGYTVGNQNLQSGKSALNIADGAMSGVADYLQRMRELAIRSNNPLMNNDDKQYIQDEIDQLKQGINDAVGQAKYNEQDLLDEDGSFKLVTDGNATEMEISKSGLNSDMLGINDFNVLENFDLDSIDKALEKVSSARSMNGAQTNAIDYTSAYNATAAENMTASQSTLEDADMAEEVVNAKKNDTLDAFQIMMQKQQQQDEATKNAQIFAQ